MSPQNQPFDEGIKTAVLVWEYRNTPDTFAGAMGNVQRLSNGNSLVGWGTGQLVTEVRPDNSKAFELALGGYNISYRTFRFPSRGYPMTQPTLVAITGTSAINLAYSWNGATDIAYYRLYGGNNPHPTTLIGTQVKSGFETETTIPANINECRYFRVMPIDILGRETLYSSEVTTCKLYYLPLMLK